VTVDKDNLTIQFDSKEEAMEVLVSLVAKWEGCIILSDPAGQLVEAINEIAEN
jgi:hypothetical protein